MPPPPPLLPTPGVSVDVVCSMPFIGTVHPQLRLDWGDANRNVEGSSLSGSNAATRETSDSSAAMPIVAAAVGAPRQGALIKALLSYLSTCTTFLLLESLSEPFCP